MSSCQGGLSDVVVSARGIIVSGWVSDVIVSRRGDRWHSFGE